MRKKFLSLLVSGLMIFSSWNVSVLAEEETENVEADEIVDVSEAEETDTETTEAELELFTEESEESDDSVETVAYVDGVGYGTLAEAIQSASYGATVVLERDVKENIVIAENQDIVLNLNGKTLNGGTVKKTPAILNQGRLTILDLSDNSGRVIREDYAGSESASYYVIDNQGTMTISGGTISNHSDKSSLIRNAGEGKSATLLVNGGNIIQDEFTAIKNDDLGELNVSGGVITSATESAIQSWATTNIFGGTVNGAVYVSHWSDELDSKTVINNTAVINGRIIVRNYTSGLTKNATLGIFDGTLNVTAWELSEGASVIIGGGNFSGEPVPASEYVTLTEDYTAVAYVDGNAYQTLQAAINAASDGETVNLVKDVEESILVNNKTLVLAADGHTISPNGGNWTVTVSGGASLTVLGGNGAVIESAASGAVCANGGQISLSDVTVNGKSYGVVSAGVNGVVNLTNTNVTAETAVRVQTNGTVNVLGNANVITGSKTAAIHVSAGTVNVFGGQFSADNGFGVVASGTTSEINIYDGNISGKIGAGAQKGGVLNISGGTISSEGTAIECQYGHLNISEAEGKNTVITGASGIQLYNNPYNNAENANSSTLVMSGGTILTNNFAITGNNLSSAGTKVEITGGTVESTDGYSAIYWPMEGELTIGGDAKVVGGSAVNAKMGTITVKDNAVLEANGIFAEDIDSILSGWSVADGSALTVVAQQYGKLETQYKESPNLTVNVLGGTLSSQNGNAVTVYNIGSEDTQNAAITVASDAALNPASEKAAVKYLSNLDDVDVIYSGDTALISSGTVTLDTIAVAVVNFGNSVAVYNDIEDALASEETVIVIANGTISFEVLEEAVENLTLIEGVELNVTNLPEDKEVVYTNNGDGTVSVALADKEVEEPEKPIDPTPEDPTPEDPTPEEPAPENPNPGDSSSNEPQPSNPIVSEPVQSVVVVSAPSRPQTNTQVTPEPEVEDEEENSEYEEIENNDTPLASEENVENENIEDNETPLASGEKKTNWTLPIFGGIAALVLIFFIILFKRKKDEEAQAE